MAEPIPKGIREYGLGFYRAVVVVASLVVGLCSLVTLVTVTLNESGGHGSIALPITLFGTSNTSVSQLGTQSFFSTWDWLPIGVILLSALGIMMALAAPRRMVGLMSILVGIGAAGLAVLSYRHQLDVLTSSLGREHAGLQVHGHRPATGGWLMFGACVVLVLWPFVVLIARQIGKSTRESFTSHDPWAPTDVSPQAVIVAPVVTAPHVVVAAAVAPAVQVPPPAQFQPAPQVPPPAHFQPAPHIEPEPHVEPIPQFQPAQFQPAQFQPAPHLTGNGPMGAGVDPMAHEFTREPDPLPAFAGAVAATASVTENPVVATVPVAEDTFHAEGWYPDPVNPAGLRWWDGEQWTGHIATR